VEGKDAKQSPTRLLAADLELKWQALCLPGDDEPALAGADEGEATPGLNHDVDVRTLWQIDGQRTSRARAAGEEDQ